MPSHLSSIGFPVETEEEFAELAERVARDATTVSVKGGKYLRWAGADGEELWLQLDSRGELIGMSPHFSGPSCVRVGVVNRVVRPNDSKLDGAFHAWASPDDTPENGEYPFVFDLPDANVYSDLEIPSVAEAQVAAFAHEVAFFESEATYESSQDADGTRFASKSFVPTGLFHTARTGDPAPAEAVFTGHVVQASVCTNAMSGMQFYCALVDTLGGRYDVVIDPELLDRVPTPGGILSGSFWLSGRLTSHPKKKKGWFGQLLGGTG